MEEAHAPANQLADTIEMAARVAPGSEGLIFLPYLLGERAPIWNEDARGVFFGIGTGHTRFHFLRAVMEGISFSLCQVGLALEETLGPIWQLYASGGFIRSTEWLQMMADIFNKRVCVTHDADASAIGAAMLGFYAIRQVRRLEDLAALVSSQEVYEPDPARHRIYQESYQRFASLYLALKGEFSLLAGNVRGTSGEV
jgi:gluconokinase